MMPFAIKNFPSQFAFEPTIWQARRSANYDRFFYVGMGGSHLAADLALRWNPNLPLTITSDYGLPEQVKQAKRPLIIAGSYSGNTEETIDGYREARKRKLSVAVIASGGKLIEMAKKDGVPFSLLPNTGIQPRMALGFGLRAVLKLLNDKRGLEESAKLAKSLKPDQYKTTGETLARALRNRVPVIYASARNAAIAYNWKIKFNETGKAPAFYNLLPELNHNEMNGFDVKRPTKKICAPFHFIFLTDTQDHPRVVKRMDILARLYRDRGLCVEEMPLRGKQPFERMFGSLLTADWAAVALGDGYGLETEQVPMVEEFKRLMA